MDEELLFQNLEEQSFQYIGDFEVFSGELLITDPCYDADSGFQQPIRNAQNGKWETWYRTDEKGRPTDLLAFYHEWGFPEEGHFSDFLSGLGVDSGQIGMYDLETFKKEECIPEDLVEHKDFLLKDAEGEEERFYYANCSITLNADRPAGVLNNGCVSATAYGDGVYSAALIVDPDEYVQSIWIELT